MGSWEHYSRGKDDSAKVAITAVVGIVAVLFLPMIIHTIVMILAGVGVSAIGGGGAYLWWRVNYRQPREMLQQRGNAEIARHFSYKELQQLPPADRLAILRGMDNDGC
jgi:protein-S-isoprenylcysteine O-methyltransferase Ste14